MLPVILVAVGAYLIGDSVLEDGKKYAKGGEVDWSNEENEKLGKWLLSTKSGKHIISESKNSEELEKNVRDYAKDYDGIAGLSMDDEDEGLEWVTFDDLYNEINSRKQQGGYMADGGEIKTLIGKEFRPFTATSSNEYNVEIVDIDLDNVTYKYKDGEVKKAKTSDFLDSYIQVKDKGGYMAKGGEAATKNFNTMMNVGKSKYVINYHNGEKTHKDGSPFYDLATFKNKKDFEARKKALIAEGYKEM